MAIGVFGGTFDPIHLGHLRLARALRDELQLAEVRLIPTGQPPHRPHPQTAPAHRLAMLQLAIADEVGLYADDREIRRPRLCYTVETLQEIRAEIGAQMPLYCLIGADSFVHLHTWHQWRQLFTLAHLVVAWRPGFAPDQLDDAVAQEWKHRQASDFAKQSPAGTIRALSLAPADFSATTIRATFARGATPADQLTPQVLDYIRHHRLYPNTNGTL